MYRLVRWLIGQVVIVFLALITLSVVCVAVSVVGVPLMKYVLEPFIKAGGGIIALVLFAVMGLKNMDDQIKREEIFGFCKDCPSKGHCVYQNMGDPKKNCPDKDRNGCW